MVHKTQEKLITAVNDAKKKVKVGGKYIHYKHPDKYYTVLYVGFIEETEELCVVYEAEYGKKLVWVRPLENFLAKVILKDGIKVARFTKAS